MMKHNDNYRNDGSYERNRNQGQSRFADDGSDDFRAQRDRFRDDYSYDPSRCDSYSSASPMNQAGRAINAGPVNAYRSNKSFNDDNGVSDEEYAAKGRSRNLRRLFIAVTNEVVDLYFPLKTLFADIEFDIFRNIFLKYVRYPHKNYVVPTDEEINSVDDEQLRALFFIVGGTLLGRLGSREERNKKIEEIRRTREGFEDYDPANEKFWPKPVEDDEYSDEIGNEAYGDPRDGAQYEDVRYQNSEYERLPDGSGQEYNDWAEDDYVDDEQENGFTAVNTYDERGDGGYYVETEERERRFKPRNVPAYLEPNSRQILESRPISAPRPASSTVSGGGLRGFVQQRRSNTERNSENVVYASAGQTDRFSPDVVPVCADKNDVLSVQNTDDGGSLKEKVALVAELLTNYFSEKKVQGEYDLILLEMLAKLRKPEIHLEIDKLPMYIDYAERDKYHKDPNVRVYKSDDPELSRTIPTLEQFKDAISNRPVNERAPLIRIFTILEKEFPSFFVSDPEGIDRFKDEFPQLPDEVVREGIRQAHGVIGKLAPTMDDVYLTIVKKVLRDKYPTMRFRKDASDFAPFVSSFKQLGGPGVDVDVPRLRLICMKAGAQFILEHPVEVEEPKQNAPTLSRAAVIRGIMTTVFAKGIDPKSKTQLEEFRNKAKSEYDMDFDSLDDDRLRATIARCCVQCDYLLHSITDKDREELKKIVRDEINANAKILFYESIYQRHEEWLNSINIDSAKLLTAFLVKYFASFSFYDEYMEPAECDESEREKIEEEIKRVWTKSKNSRGQDYYEDRSSAILSMFLYVPQERIERALELNTRLFKKTGKFDADGNALYARETVEDKTPADDSKVLYKSWDEQYEQTVNEENGGNAVESQEPEAKALSNQNPSLLDYAEEEANEDEEKVDTEDVEAEEVDEDSEEEYKEVEWSHEAAEFVKQEVADWFEQGGAMIYYDAFVEKNAEKLDELGTPDVDAEGLYALLIGECPEYDYEDSYLTVRSNEPHEELELIKQELDRVWPVEQAARRIAELVKITYLSADSLIDNLESIGLEKRSNGYLVRIQKKVEGSKKTRRVLVKRKRSR